MVGGVEIISGISSISIIWTLTLYFSWFLIIFLGYISRKWWKGLIIGYLVWSPILILSVIAPWSELKGLGIFIIFIFASGGAVVGVISGFVGSKKKRRSKS